MIQRVSLKHMMAVSLVTGTVALMGLSLADEKSATPATSEPSIEAQLIEQAKKSESEGNKSLTPAAKAKMANETYTPVDVMAVVQKPEQFKEQYISFDATFNSFSTLGLDYPKAERSSTDYISVVVLRPDVGEHRIPMSELKLFFPRKDSDSVLELESGDEVSIKGHVFSTALNDPWVDITELTVLKKAAPKKTADDE